MDSMRAGVQAETSGDDNVKTFALMMAAYDSAERGEVVKVAP